MFTGKNLGIELNLCWSDCAGGSHPACLWTDGSVCSDLPVSTLDWLIKPVTINPGYTNWG